jgi:hypothetical protein
MRHDAKRDAAAPQVARRWEMTTNLNEFARRVAYSEGLKVQLPIGQIKEVMRIVFQELATLTPIQVDEILKRFRK